MKLEAKDIIKDSDLLIRTKSENVPTPLSEEDETLALALLDHVLRSQDEEIAEKEGLRGAVGIAAIQVGVPKKLLAIVIGGNEDEEDLTFCLANARIVSHSVQPSYLANGEGCLSVEEEHEGIVPRAARIKVRAYDVLGKQDVEIRAEGYPAIVLQHEIDHFSGTLFYDHINKLDPWAPIEDAIVIE